MSDTAPITEEQLAKLRTVAEAPLIAPSKRVEAWTILKALGSHEEKHADAKVTARDLAARVAAGERRPWRERRIAVDLGVLPGELDN